MEFFNIFACINSDSVEDNITRKQIINLKTEAKLCLELDAYFTFLTSTRTMVIESVGTTQMDVKVIKRMLRSKYSHKRHSMFWKIGLFGKIYIDFLLNNSVFRVTFRAEKDGSFVTRIHLEGERELFEAGNCSYCRQYVSPDDMKFCYHCGNPYCSRECQTIDWVAYHMDDCERV